MIWSNKLFSGISELVGQCSGSQSGELYQTCGHPLHCFANTRVFYAAIRKAQRSVHLQSLLWWVTDRAVWERPINQPCSLIILLFAVLFLSQISSPVQLTGQLPKHFQCRPEGEKQRGGQDKEEARRGTGGSISWLCYLREFCISKQINLWTVIAALTLQRVGWFA